MRWEPPPEDSQNGIITGYKIRFRRKNTRRSDTLTTDGNRRSLALTGLQRGKEYQVKVWALNVNGTSPTTQWILGETFVNDLDGEDSSIYQSLTVKISHNICQRSNRKTENPRICIRMDNNNKLTRYCLFVNETIMFIYKKNIAWKEKNGIVCRKYRMILHVYMHV